MMGRAARTWFGTMRRDAGLFAVIASAIMLVNLLQPLTAARAAGQNDWVICTVHGAAAPVSGESLPAGWPDECPICVAPGGCPVKLPLHAPAVALDPAHPGRDFYIDAPPVETRAHSPLPLPGDPPPAIRAPPRSV